MSIDTSEPALVQMFEKGQVGRIRTEFMRKDDVIAALQAENERLQKAGDALLECHKIRDDMAYSMQEQSPDVAKAMLAWLAAKESQP